MGTLSHVVKLTVAGNHDAVLEGDGGGWVPKNSILLNGTMVSIPISSILRQKCITGELLEQNIKSTSGKSINIFGTPLSPPGVTLCNAFQDPALGLEALEKAMKSSHARPHPELFDSSFCNVDILVTHARNSIFEQVIFPFDTNQHGPRIWAYGHFHNDHGIQREWSSGGRSCLCINPAVSDMIYRPIQPVVVVEYVVIP